MKNTATLSKHIALYKGQTEKKHIYMYEKERILISSNCKTLSVQY